MKTTKMNKQGISLIVLVITIIVMIILATAVVITLSNSGIISKANAAVDATDLANVQDLAALLWSDAYIDLKLKGEVDVGKLRGEVLEKLEKAVPNYDSKYDVKITLEGVNVSLKSANELPDTFEGVEMYAKLYSYDDGSGSLLELSNSAETVTTEQGVTLAEDYGNIGNVRYKYIYEEQEYEQDGVTVYISSEANSVMPPWLTLVEEKYEEDEFIEERSLYYDQNNIIKVNIANPISPKSTACLFAYCYGVQEIQGIENLDTSNVIDMHSMFFCCESLTSLNVSNFNTSNVIDMNSMFAGCSGLTSLDVSKFDTSNVRNMANMFDSCRGLTSLDVSKFDTSNVTDMGWMFAFCENLTSLDLSRFDTSNVTNMAGMFWVCNNLTSLDLSKFDTSNVRNMANMFNECRGLTSLDVSKFDTSNVTDMGWMFQYCSNLTSLNVSNFGTSNVTDMNNMFAGCSNLTSLDVSKFDTSNVADMNGMFANCSGLTSLDVSKFDTSNVIDMYSMFKDCTNLEVIYIGEDWVTAENAIGMFKGCKAQTLTLK